MEPSWLSVGRGLAHNAAHIRVSGVTSSAASTRVNDTEISLARGIHAVLQQKPQVVYSSNSESIRVKLPHCNPLTTSVTTSPAIICNDNTMHTHCLHGLQQTKSVSAAIDPLSLRA